ncbi:hypothetical protein [Scytonema sp. PRP1]|uniref:hypothetical protein n=1 Tax=Scytonema sp. PRP1 TaxID=3120513 RepID=UPI00300D3316
MKHINQMVSQLQVSLEELREVCDLLNLQVDGDKISDPTEHSLLQVKQVASKENKSLRDAALYLLQLRSECQQADGYHFNKREYIKQRFGVDPEEAAPDSFVGILYRDLDKGIQLGQLRHQVVLESSTLALEERIFHGTGSTSFGETDSDRAVLRVESRIGDNFFGQINWEEINHPLLVGSSTPQQKQLKSSQPKTGQSQKK